LSKYHAIPHQFWAKVKVAFDFEVLFVNYPNSEKITHFFYNVSMAKSLLRLFCHYFLPLMAK